MSVWLIAAFSALAVCALAGCVLLTFWLRRK